jgi:hypothetical protein
VPTTTLRFATTFHTGHGRSLIDSAHSVLSGSLRRKLHPHTID